MIESVIAEQLEDLAVEVILFEKWRVIEERDGKPRWDRDATYKPSQAGMEHFPQIGRFSAESPGVIFPLIFQLGELFKFKIGFRREEIGAPGQSPPGFQCLAGFGRPQHIPVIASLEIDELAFERFQQL